MDRANEKWHRALSRPGWKVDLSWQEWYLLGHCGQPWATTFD